MIRENMMRKSILRASAALQAVALLGAGSTAFIAATPAAAQDYTSGSLTGTVTTANGAPVAGALVTIRSIQQGSTIRTTSNGQGMFSFSSLPPGDYDVTVAAAGNRSFTATAVRVEPGRTSDVPVALTGGTAEEGNAIVVSGRRLQAFTGTTTGKNVDVAELTKTIPLGRTLTDVALLAPGTTKGDSAFGNLASIGGSSVAENAYYINGLNITNFDTYVGSAEVPFDFYKTVEVKSGGYPAEFGRATGGIVNAVSKAGTNELYAAFHVSWAPEFLRSTAKDLVTCNTAGVCINSTKRSADTANSLNVTGELGMPIIRDRLFVYGMIQTRNDETVTISATSRNATEDRNTSPFWAAKIDAIPIDNHHFELTMFDTRNTTIRRVHSFIDNAEGGEIGAVTSSREFYGGGFNFVGKYTGRFTDWLTLSAAYGRVRDRFDSLGVDASAQLPLVRNDSGGPVFGFANGAIMGAQTSGSAAQPYKTQRKFYRGDADIRLELAGQHHFRLGLDREDNTLSEAQVRTGGSYLCAQAFLTPAACAANGGGGGASLLFQAPDTVGSRIGVPIVEINYFNTGGAFTSTNSAYYLQDEWTTPFRGLTLNLGIRRDDFVVKDPDGRTFIGLRNNYAPRLGFTYDAFPSVRGQFFGSYGWYYLPVASNVAFRSVGAEYYLSERYYVSGNSLDSRGLPVLLAPVTNNGDFQDTCVFKLNPLSTGVNCNQTGDGTSKNADTYIARNLKPTRESEFILGYRQKLNQFNVGVSFTHRQTDNLNEDVSLDQGIINYCADNGIAGCDDYYTTGSAQFTIVNVGKDVVVQVAGGPLAGQTITITAAENGYPKAKRTYDALDFVFDRPWDGHWSLGGSYTWSKSKGNSEGFVNSDIGQDDAGTTIDFDFVGFTDNTYGYLPNDRRHRIKVYGAYAPFENLILGANYTLESPRHLSCRGFNPNDIFANNYNGPYNFYCNGQPSPRGTAQQTDWNSQLNLSARYNFNVPTGQQVTLRADVFNVFNSQAVLYRREFGDLRATYDPDTNLPIAYTPDPNYGQPRVYQARRYVRLGLDVLFGGGFVPPPPAPVEVVPPPPPPPPATQTCPDGSVIAADAACPVPPPPPPPPPAPVERGERGQ
jgi:hypothetical protein